MQKRRGGRAQVAFEFVILVSIAFMALLVFTAFVRDNFDDVESDTSYYKLKDLAMSVKSEITMASTLDDGYQRSFFVPLTIDGLEYNITQVQDFMTFSSGGSDYQVRVPPFTGMVVKGNNEIKKTNGTIELNPG
ncbi:TPA: hypothetical protein HA265_02250 [Candidatus Woesearchaeota archaeon]|nr:hypothetical protein [Candidatus Woesearchaeota archaeon]